jgi:hypothetical protein
LDASIESNTCSISTDDNTINSDIAVDQQQSKNKIISSKYQLPLQSKSSLNQNHLFKKHKNDHKRIYSCRCSFYGCTNTNTSPNIKMIRVPRPYTKQIPNHDTADKRSITAYYKKKHHHLFFMRANTNGSSVVKDNQADRQDTAYDRVTIRQWEKRKHDLHSLPEHGDAEERKNKQTNKYKAVTNEKPKEKHHSADINNNNPKVLPMTLSDVGMRNGLFI